MSTANLKIALLRWPGRSRNKADDIEHCAVDIEQSTQKRRHRGVFGRGPAEVLFRRGT